MRNPDILTHSNAQTMYVPINFEGYYEKIMRAGSPISMKGKLANDNTAMGILLDDVTREYPMGEIVILGFVDYEIAQNASGITLTPEAKSAMKNITFVGDPESGSSGGGGKSVQPDWNQNDPTQPDYVKNRTHWSKTEFVTIFEGTILFDEMNEFVDLEQIPYIRDGQVCDVTFNGTKYSCTAIRDAQGVMLGNQALLIAPIIDHGEPFFIGIDDTHNQLMFIVALEYMRNSCDFSITATVELFHKIESKFLPVMSGNADFGIVNRLIMRESVSPLEYFQIKIGVTTLGEIREYERTTAIYKFHYAELDFYTGNVLIVYGVSGDGTTIGHVRMPALDRDGRNCCLHIEFDGFEEDTSLATRVYLEHLDSMILKSSTSGSEKLFKITVDDSGTLKATEV